MLFRTPSVSILIAFARFGALEERVAKVHVNRGQSILETKFKLLSGDAMDHARAAALLQAERVRVQDLLSQSSGAGLDDRAGANEQGDMSDPATSLTLEEQEDAVTSSLRERLSAIERAEQRLLDGDYGRSIRSGDVIPDERLEADPAAELTVEEALEI